MEENIKILEELKDREYHFSGSLYSTGVVKLDEQERNAIENLIKGYKELQGHTYKLEEENARLKEPPFFNEDNYIKKSKIQNYLNKMEKRCDKPKFSVMKKEIEKILQEGDK